jgi:hypothetical protein
VPELIGVLKNLVHSKDFCLRHKENQMDFTRARSLPFHELIFSLMNMNNSSYQSELDKYFKVVRHLEIAECIIYKGSLSKARAKLKYEAFVELNDKMLQHDYTNFLFETWCGFNFFAVDGTMLRVPDEKRIINHLLFNRSSGKVKILVKKIRKIFIQTTESARPNRKFPRRHRVQQKRFFLEYKTFC